MIRNIIVCALFSLAASAVIPDQILSYRNENDGSGNYDFSFETSNGIKRQESGRVVNAGAENEFIDVVGMYSYTDVDGKLVQISYHADENGYHIIETKPMHFEAHLFSGVPAGVVASLLGK